MLASFLPSTHPPSKIKIKQYPLVLISLLFPASGWSLFAEPEGSEMHARSHSSWQSKDVQLVSRCTLRAYSFYASLLCPQRSAFQEAPQVQPVEGLQAGRVL